MKKKIIGPAAGHICSDLTACHVGSLPPGGRECEPQMNVFRNDLWRSKARIATVLIKKNVKVEYNTCFIFFFLEVDGVSIKIINVCFGFFICNVSFVIYFLVYSKIFDRIFFSTNCIYIIFSWIFIHFNLFHNCRPAWPSGLSGHCLFTRLRWFTFESR